MQIKITYTFDLSDEDHKTMYKLKTKGMLPSNIWDTIRNWFIAGGVDTVLEEIDNMKMEMNGQSVPTNLEMLGGEE